MRIGIMALAGTAPIGALRSLGVSRIRTSPRGLVSGGRLDHAGVDRFRDEWAGHVDAGFRLNVVTPFPKDIDEHENREASWYRIGAELGEALGDLVEAWQIGNELNIWQFREPLRTIPEAVRFVACLGAGLRESSPASRLGINAFGVGEGAAALYGALYGPDAPISLDYVGVDAYPGCWEPGGPEDWRTIVDRAWTLGRGRPVAVCEIGFPSQGELAAPGELTAFLRDLGYKNVDSVERDRGRLLAASPPPLAAAFERLPSGSWAEDFEDSASHLLRKWRHGWGPGPHTPEKQARFFETALGILLPDPRIEEVLLFMYRDMPMCWSCGRLDCPLETSWGFVDRDGRRKPVFAAVQRLIAPAAG